MESKMRTVGYIVPTLLVIGGCGNPQGATCLEDPDWGDAPQCAAWRINTDASSTYIDGALTEIQIAEVEEVDGVAYIRVETQGIPAYAYTLTQTDVDGLTDRPKASEDFADGSPTVSTGDVVEFGQDIGYDNFNCDLGYWPPGPECAVGQDVSGLIPLEPVAAGDTDCETGADKLGLWVSGTAIYGWTDTQSYNNDGVWLNLATKLEVYDIDICGGHAGFGGEYHHHGSSSCLIDLLEDDGTGHSPIYGIAADGYPVYGPWQASDTLAQSCWKTRDYDTVDSETGCGESGVRSCTLIDPTDPSAGTETAASNGPSTSDTVLSLSSNEFLAESGLYYEDYWFDSSCPDLGDEALDVHNGHEHDDLGYHYHVTVELQDDGHFTDVFPMHIGPSFAGEIPDDGISGCNSGITGPGGGPPL
jgi:hypothetical protein